MFKGALLHELVMPDFSNGFSDPIDAYLYGTPRFGDPKTPAIDILDRAVTRLDTDLYEQPRLKARLLDIIAGVNCNLGRFAESENLLSDAAKLREELRHKTPSGDFRRDQALHLFQQGKLSQAMGQYADAARHLDSCLRIYRDILPDNDLQVAEVMFQSGLLFLEWKKPADAEAFFDRAMQIRKDYLHPQHKLILITSLALATCRGDSNDLGSIGFRVAQMLDDPEVGKLALIAVQTQIAKSNGDYEQAVKLHRQTLVELEKRLSKDNPLFLLALGDYAGTLFEIGDYKQAMATVQPAIEAGQLLAPGHPHLMQTYRKLGYEMFLAERYAEAESWFSKASDDASQTPAARVETMMWRIENLIGGGKIDFAWEILESIDRTPVGVEFDVWHSILAAKINERKGDVKNAAKWRESAKQIADKCDRNFEASTAIDRYADLYQAAGDLKEAERLLRLALKKERTRRPDTHPRVAHRLYRLGEFLLQAGRADEAIPLLEQSLEVRKRQLPVSDVRIKKTQDLLVVAETANSERD